MLLPQRGTAYLVGSGVPSLAQKLVATQTGLLVPAHALRAVAPIDLIRAYMTMSEAFGTAIGLEPVLQWIRSADQRTWLIAAATLLAQRERLGEDWFEQDRALVGRLFREPHATRILGIMGTNRPLLAAQGILVLLKSCLQLAATPGDTDTTRLVPAILVLQEHLGAVSEETDEPGQATPDGRLFREILRSQSFYSSKQERLRLAHFHQRWYELPAIMAGERGWVDLAHEFDEATGVPMNDLLAVGIGLWAHVNQNLAPVIPLSYLSSLGWEAARLERVMALISRSSEDLGAALSEDDASFQYEWSFDAIRRFPVVRLDADRVLVLSPNLLLERVFGWLPIFDLISALNENHQDSRASRARAFFQKVCERQALQSLEAMVGSGPTKRLYVEEELLRAYGGPTADAAVDSGSAWIVFEVSTRQMTRPSVVGDTAEAVATDLVRGIYDKVRQIDATIRAISTDEAKLTGGESTAVRRFIPVLVVAEGFPVNPMTISAIESGIAALGLLGRPGTEKLRIIDQEELDLIEGAIEHAGVALLGLLQDWARGALSAMPFKDWMVVERRMTPDLPSRLRQPFERAWQPAIEALQTAATTSAEQRQSQ